MVSPTVNTFPRPQKRRHGLGCIAWSLLILVLLLLGLSMAWLFVIRPPLHNLAVAEINATLDRTEEDIHPPPFFLPGIPIPIPIQEHTLTNLLTPNGEASDPVKNPVAHITPSNVRLDFQVYSFPCAITAVPRVDNGHLVVSDVNIEGIVRFIMSPDEMTTLLDTHLSHAQELFQHSVTNVQLQNQEMDLTFQ
jgi:hypothetical protein